MFKQVMKKIGVIILAYVLLNVDGSLLLLIQEFVKDGKFSSGEQIGFVVWAMVSLAIFIGVAYRFKLLSLKEINWRRLVAIASLNLVIFFLGDLLGYFIGQLTHNAAMENQAALDQMFINVPAYLQFAVVGFIIPIMEEIIFRGLLAKVLFGKYLKTGLFVSSLLFMAGHLAFTPQTIIIYGTMSAGLAITYYKTKHIEYSMGVHILNNSISVLLSLFV